MQRVLKTIKLGDGTVKYVVRLLDIDSTGADIRRRQAEFVKEIFVDGATNFTMYAGPSMFDKLEIHHDGERWVARLEAEEKL